MPFWGHLGNFRSSRLGNVFAGFVANNIVSCDNLHKQTIITLMGIFVSDVLHRHYGSTPNPNNDEGKSWRQICACTH